MITPVFLNFLAMLLIAGLLIRLIEVQFPDTVVGRALTVLY